MVCVHFHTHIAVIVIALFCTSEASDVASLNSHIISDKLPDSFESSGKSQAAGDSLLEARHDVVIDFADRSGVRRAVTPRKLTIEDDSSVVGIDVRRANSKSAGDSGTATEPHIQRNSTIVEVQPTGYMHNVTVGASAVELEFVRRQSGNANGSSDIHVIDLQAASERVPAPVQATGTGSTRTSRVGLDTFHYVLIFAAGGTIVCLGGSVLICQVQSFVASPPGDYAALPEQSPDPKPQETTKQRSDETREKKHSDEKRGDKKHSDEKRGDKKDSDEKRGDKKEHRDKEKKHSDEKKHHGERHGHS